MSRKTCPDSNGSDKIATKYFYLTSTSYPLFMKKILLILKTPDGFQMHAEISQLSISINILT